MLSGIVAFFSRKKKHRIALTGLDCAGKTTLLYSLNAGQPTDLIPQIGMHYEILEHKDIHFTSWDVGGSDKIEALRRPFYKDTAAVMFIVDCNDHDRMFEAHKELQKLYVEDDLKHCPLLVLANKQDIPTAATIEEVIGLLGIASLPADVEWNVQGTIISTGLGVPQAFQWLSGVFDRHEK